tara:strand:- start:452 stop:1882 length:1431 start_codon:yes stop_codon:yes gene_type:complete
MIDLINKYNFTLLTFRILILTFLFFQNINFLQFKINWKLYLLIVFLWFSLEIFLKDKVKNSLFFETFLFVGLLKLIFVLISTNYQEFAFLSPPDSKVYKSLADNLFRCGQYSNSLDQFCNGDIYYKRGPTYSIFLSIFSLGGNIHIGFTVLVQIILCSLTFSMVLKMIRSDHKNFTTQIVFILICLNPLPWTFSRLALSETLGSFLIIFSIYLVDYKGLNSKLNLIWLTNIILALFLSIQYFLAVGLIYLKNFLFRKNKLKFLFINVLLISVSIFFWGYRNSTSVGEWDFNPATGCYLEKNIIEAIEARKLNLSIYEIREQGITYQLLKGVDIQNQNNSPYVCKKFLELLPNYYLENFEMILDNYKFFLTKFFSPEQACQYEDILCEKGYWFWVIGTVTKFGFGLSLMLVLLQRNYSVVYNIAVYLAVLLLITVLVTIDAPRMRSIFEPLVYLVIGYGLNYFYVLLTKYKNKIKKN